MDINYDQVYEYRKVFFKWIQISKMLNVDINHLNRWRKSNNFIEPFRHLTDEEVNEIIANFIITNKDQGDRMARSHIRSMNLYCTKEQIRSAFILLDPERRAARRLGNFTLIPRQQYFSKGPLHVWHMDGNHKLNISKFRIIIHGAIDGHSRALIFLTCSNNNSSKQVLNSFVKGVHANNLINGKLPYTIRFDKGLENVLVADLMICLRGEGNQAVLTGKSVHNQRIERIWLDVRKNVIKYIEELFIDMENDETILLDRYDDKHLFILHYLFIPHINEKLNIFMTDWNNHMISDINYSPSQILLLHQDLEPPLIICPPIDCFHRILNDDEYNDDPNNLQMIHTDPVRNPFPSHEAYEYFIEQINLRNASIDINDLHQVKMNKFKWVKNLMYHIIT